MNKDFSLDKLKRYRKRNKSKSQDDYFKRFGIATILESKISKLLKEDRYGVNRARQNYIVNLVTALEVFLKDVIMEFSGRWDFSQMDRLLSATITLNKAFDLFHKNKIKREHLICHYYSFQNIQTIDTVFSGLLGVQKFLNEIGKVECHPFPADVILKLDDGWKDWRKNLANIFELRHRIVHEGSFEKISKKDCEQYRILFFILPDVILYYIKNKFKIPAQKVVFWVPV